ncbi:MAG: DUF302 domain-containing protein [Thiotrichales bacterium]
MYTFEISLNSSFDVAVTQVIDALQAEKLGVVSDIAVSNIIQNKLGQTIRPYRILGACAPGLALRAIEADPNAGALLPCNIVIREVDDQSVVVAFMDPVAVLRLAEDSRISAVGEEALEKLRRVADRLR